MSLKKYFTPKHSFESANSELDKLEKTHRSELRMISTAAFKFRSKFMKHDNPRSWRGENEASTLKMYETHFPGFCYLRDGKYRKNVMNVNKNTAISLETSEKIKALLFTDNELDIKKVLCLHLLGTHVQSKRHIQRKDGRFCTFVKSSNHGNKRLTLQSLSQRTISCEKEILSTLDEILPRYVLEIRLSDRNLPLNPAEMDTHIDDETGKKKQPQIPVYINNDIRVIVSSVIEALESVNSVKLKELIASARDSEKLRNIIHQQDIHQFMTELAGSYLVSNFNSYDVIMTYPVFEKVPEPSAADIVAQVLDITGDTDMRNVLNLARKTICRRYEELVLHNALPGKKKRMQAGKGSIAWNTSKTSFLSGDTSTKTCSSGFTSGALSSDYRIHKYLADSNEKLKHDNAFQIIMHDKTKTEKNSNLSLQKGIKSPKKIESNSQKSLIQQGGTQESDKFFAKLGEFRQEENSTVFKSSENKAESRIQQYARFHDSELNKYDLRNLSNSQRILLGLKVASMKNRPLNMHQFENKKQIDIVSIITSITRANKSDLMETSFVVGNDLEKRKANKAESKIDCIQVQDLGNLTRASFSNFRHDVATAENKKRVKEFIQTTF